MPTTDITTPTQDFTFDGAHVRIHVDGDGDIHYCAKDVAAALGYTNPLKAVRDHCRGERFVHPLQTAGGKQDAVFIKRSDVYRLITSSRLPSAERFESWLFDEVVPSIQDHGAYITPTAMQQLAADPDFIINLGYALKDANEKREQAERIAAQKQLQLEASEQQVAELAPKAEALDSFTAVEGSYSVGDAAKILSNDLNITIGRNRLYEFMAEINWVFRDSTTRTWKAYQSQVDNGRLEMKAHTEHGTHHDGTTFPFPPTVRITAKGLDELRRRLLSNGTTMAA